MVLVEQTDLRRPQDPMMLIGAIYLTVYLIIGVIKDSAYSML